MSEKRLSTGEHERREPLVRIKADMFMGIGEIIGDEWMVRIFVPQREICYWTIPCTGDMAADIDRVQREICQAIDQFVWDPMSQA